LTGSGNGIYVGGWFWHVLHTYYCVEFWIMRDTVKIWKIVCKSCIINFRIKM